MARSNSAAAREAQLDAAFAALADPTRRRILARLSKGTAAATELAEPFAISQPAVSKHLSVLERAGLIRREREGRYRRCSLDPRPLEAANAFLERYRVLWEDNLARLARYLEDDAS